MTKKNPQKTKNLQRHLIVIVGQSLQTKLLPTCFAVELKLGELFVKAQNTNHFPTTFNQQYFDCSTRAKKLGLKKKHYIFLRIVRNLI